MTGRVIVLNGVSSAGKSSIAAAMRSLLSPSPRYAAMDDRLSALPRATFGTPDGLTFVPGDEEGAPCTGIVAGPLVRHALAAMREEVAAAARGGRDVIVDEVLLRPDDEAAYRALLPGRSVRLVAVRVPLPVAEARERARGDRVLGLARWQFDRVHRGRRYDMEVDTGTGTPAGHASAILHGCGWYYRDGAAAAPAIRSAAS